MRTRIKICGFTRVEDAVAAAKLGVDAIGLVFYPPSPRSISIEQARNIVNALPAFVSVVALFVDEQESQIKQVLNELAIDVIQFHGNEPANRCNIYNKPYLKAIRMTKQRDVLQIAEQYNDASALLLDAYQLGIKGGSGHQFDWDLIPKQCALPIVLAGGLHVDNARLAVQSVRPYALDVSSGVETEKGIKDVAKMAAFIQQVKEGDN
ncbi:MAG: phosphoribosylanthranilate isomerase [Methylococcales symbiont of Iophon sp. n. MRB-2018]|nr:MAG: phosphoribosylanthranilate isomerase [Methylococcales symbiont of Iophon sp. n. MRB-2018]KAF3979088.1 MAG: phosphoribosylanthranilate isomerase [Methylococcales symbiont of Iophon sp. n. MRB-2018]